jgi:hypothetical protein
MYIAYGLASGVMLLGFAFLYFFFDFDITTSIIIIGILLSLLYALVFRTARAIWINIYVSYDRQADQQPEIYKSKNK